MIGLNVQGLIDLLAKASVVGVVVFFLVGLQQRWWYLAGEVADLRAALAEQKGATLAMERDRDQWKLLCLTGVHLGERAAAVAAVALPAPEASAS